MPDVVAGAPARMRVADFSTHFTGPIASRILADLGAEVVKIEDPRYGDGGNREINPKVHGESVTAVFLNADTKSLAIDRRTERWPEVVAAAARWADVVIVSDRVSVLKERGLDFETISSANDKVVYCMLPAYGNHGPWKDWSAHGQSVDVVAGNLLVEYDEQGFPRTPPTWRTAGTTASGVFAALGILNGLYQQPKVGKPVCVEVSLWGAAVWWYWRDALAAANHLPPFRGFENFGSRYSLYTTADGRLVLVAPIEKKFWHAFCDLVGLPERKEMGDWTTRFEYGDSFPEERALIQGCIGTRTMDEWGAILGGAGLPFAPMLTRAEALLGEHGAAEGVVRNVPARNAPGETFKIARAPVRTGYGEEPLPPDANMPSTGLSRIGEHTEEVMKMFGLEP